VPLDHGFPLAAVGTGVGFGLGLGAGFGVALGTATAGRRVAPGFAVAAAFRACVGVGVG